MLSYAHYFTVLLLSPFIISWPQINLDLTDSINDYRNNIVFPQDCLHTTAWIGKETDPYQIISYCIDKRPSPWAIKNPNQNQNLTFNELYQRNISSEQLYLWSAPMDLIERYQLYLNLVSMTNTSLVMGSQIFNNCTLPRFGSFCEYSFDFDISSYTSLNQMISDFYLQDYEPTTLTCYVHLQCDRGASTLCLDWTEICDGIVNCRNGIDEESCWQLETNQCQADEYRCFNGQCISKIFYDDDPIHFDCLDRSDEKLYVRHRFIRISGEPVFAKEDMVCSTYFDILFIKLSSSCVQQRSIILQKMMFSNQPANISDECWLAVKCQLANPDTSYPSCPGLSNNPTWAKIINMTCPDLMDIPASAVVFGHLFFVYTKEQMFRKHHTVPPPEYICYDDQHCGAFSSNQSLLSFKNATCRRPEDFPIKFNMGGTTRGSWKSTYVLKVFQSLHQCNTLLPSDSTICNYSMMYQCKNSSKYISKYRTCDRIQDCDYGDDEDCSAVNGSCPESASNTLFLCTINNRCIPLILVEDGKCDCSRDENDLCEDELATLNLVKTRISFPTICDGYTELIPILIDGRNETDETECDFWQCNNTYTRCNRFWNCLNGADEVDCYSRELIPCPVHHHICVSPSTFQFICLPLQQAGDNHIDCFGAIDELTICSRNLDPFAKNMYCNTHEYIGCIDSIDICVADLCKGNIWALNVSNDQCTTTYFNMKAIMDRRASKQPKSQTVSFTLNEIDHSVTQTLTENRKTILAETTVTPTIIHQVRHQRCHRGLPMRVWLDNEQNVSKEACLCSPSFYGDMCQYQKQRVSLTLRFQAYSDSQRTLFGIAVTLIEDNEERIIHSYQQFSYLYIRDCQNKFNMYLHYSARPKNITKSYAVHIDVYEKIKVAYRGSFLIPLKFPFLPVHRIAVQLIIPRNADPSKSCSAQQCLHGQYRKYSNGFKDVYFCHCDRGWSGRACDIAQNCTCSPDSVYIGMLNNHRSICVCPMDKWGPQCRLRNTRCDLNQNTTCHNNGQCIQTDEHVVSNKKIKCICQKGFSGKQCEIIDTQLIVSFQQEIILPNSVLVHFIRVMNNSSPMNGSTFKSVSLHKRTVVVDWAHPFHIAFVELSKKNYYLLTVQSQYRPSMIISKTITSNDRCPYLGEVLNETIVRYHLIRRIKYYHLACQGNVFQLSCFYDVNHFCVCHNHEQQRLANCFEFDPMKIFDCFGKSNCRNGAQCIQDKDICPQASRCVCPKCFHGTLCQFNSHGFALSLDGILGYHIQPYVRIKDQSLIVQISIAATILITITGLISGLLSIMTCLSKRILVTSCGILLLNSSITTLLTMLIFALKFFILLIVQTQNIAHKSFLLTQCISIDFLLRINLNMNQWLNSYIGVERAVITIKKTNMTTIRRKKITKYVIFILWIVNIITTIDDPIRRQLIDDDSNDEQKRIWCVLTYSSNLHMITTIMNLFHFLTPFIINMVSGPIIIIITARQRTASQTRQTFRQVLYEQFQIHKHILISPIVLVLLSVPRLIISLISSKCMEPTDNTWLYLIGYLISFLPSILSFVVLVLPSTLYKQELSKTCKRWKRALRIGNTPV